MRVASGQRWRCLAAILRLVTNRRWLRRLGCLLYKVWLDALPSRLLSLAHQEMIWWVGPGGHLRWQHLVPRDASTVLWWRLVPRLSISAVKTGASTQVHAS